MNIQKELDNLAKKEQALRNKFGARFKKHYNTLIDGIESNNTIISRAEASNIRMMKGLKEVGDALKETGTEV